LRFSREGSGPTLTVEEELHVAETRNPALVRKTDYNCIVHSQSQSYIHGIPENIGLWLGVFSIIMG
jgi:hypothetical protein